MSRNRINLERAIEQVKKHWSLISSRTKRRWVHHFVLWGETHSESRDREDSIEKIVLALDGIHPQTARNYFRHCRIPNDESSLKMQEEEEFNAAAFLFLLIKIRLKTILIKQFCLRNIKNKKHHRQSDAHVARE